MRAEAVQAFDKAVQLRPDDAGLWKHLGGALMDMGRTVINVVGNCLASAVVAQWEGEFRSEKASPEAVAALES